MATHHEGERYLDAESWLQVVPRHEGSWWPAWEHWLAQRGGDRVPPPPTGAPDAGYAPLDPAPGKYVRQP
jgi:polyhydroxyalkanoate synthase